MDAGWGLSVLVIAVCAIVSPFVPSSEDPPLPRPVQAVVVLAGVAALVWLAVVTV